MAFEFAVLDFIQAHFRTGFGDALMPRLTALGNAGIVWLALGVGLCLFRRTRKAGFAVLLALGFESLVCNAVLKLLFARLRPCDINTAISLLIARPKDFSFPSGHTSAGSAAAAALWFSRSRGRYAAALLAAGIAFSRLYLYVHFPTDILGGLLLGVFSGWLAVRLCRRPALSRLLCAEKRAE